MKVSTTNVTLENATPSAAPKRRVGLPAFVLALTVALSAGACGGSSEDANDTTPSQSASSDSSAVVPEGDASNPTVSTETPTDEPSGDDSTPPPDCLEVDRARQRLASAGSQLFNVEDAELYETLAFDTDALVADIELFRPYQDVDVVPFGTAREGLDNLKHDLIAAGEGRFTDMIRSYDAATRNGLMAEICA